MTACALALAACGGDEKTVKTVTDEPGSARVDKAIRCLSMAGYQTDMRPVDAASRRHGATGSLSVLLDVEGGSAVDSVVDVRFWDSKENATDHVKAIGDGPLDALHHEQVGAATITYSHGHSHDAEHAEGAHDDESDAVDHEVDAIAACVG